MRWVADLEYMTNMNAVTSMELKNSMEQVTISNIKQFTSVKPIAYMNWANNLKQVSRLQVSSVK